MCCLFGVLNYSGKSNNELNNLVNCLSQEATIRGTHSTGIAYNKDGVLKIYKKPKSAYEMNFKGIEDCISITGHTRHATQGSEKKNYNNHPFMGYCDNTKIALSHNGILYNDTELRKQYHIAKNKIETDSYIAVQLLEHFGELNFSNIGKMAEAVSGSFAFTMNDTQDNLYLVRGSSPLSLVHLPNQKLYIYASTDEILFSAISHTDFLEDITSGNFEIIPIKSGDIFKIDKYGKITTSKFNYSEYTYGYDWYNYKSYGNINYFDDFDDNDNDNGYYFKDNKDNKTDIDYGIDEEYLDELISVATSMGINEDFVYILLDEGFTLEEIEDYIYDEYSYCAKVV